MRTAACRHTRSLNSCCQRRRAPWSRTAERSCPACLTTFRGPDLFLPTHLPLEIRARDNTVEASARNRVTKLLHASATSTLATERTRVHAASLRRSQIEGVTGKREIACVPAKSVDETEKPGEVSEVALRTKPHVGRCERQRDTRHRGQRRSYC